MGFDRYRTDSDRNLQYRAQDINQDQFGRQLGFERDAEFGRQGLARRGQDIGYDQFGRELNQQNQQFSRTQNLADYMGYNDVGFRQQQQDLSNYMGYSDVNLRQQQQDQDFGLRQQQQQLADRLGTGDLDYRNRNLDVNQLMQQQQIDNQMEQFTQQLGFSREEFESRFGLDAARALADMIARGGAIDPNLAETYARRKYTNSRNTKSSRTSFTL